MAVATGGGLTTTRGEKGAWRPSLFRVTPGKKTIRASLFRPNNPPPSHHPSRPSTKFQIGIGGTPRSRERTLKRLDTPHHISSPVEQGRDQNTLNVIASAPHRLPLDIVVFDKGCCGSSNMSRFVEGLRAGNRPRKPLFSSSSVPSIAMRCA